MAVVPFEYDEVKRIFHLSEMAGGHAGEQHVKISNAEMVARNLKEKRRGPIHATTAFLTFDQQIKAALKLLNDGRNHKPLERLRIEKEPGKGYSGEGGTSRIELAHKLAKPQKMRYVLGHDVKTFMCVDLKMIVDKKIDNPRRLYIHTFIGMFE